MRQLKLIIIGLVFAFLGIWGGILYLGEASGQNLVSVATPTPLPTPTPTPEIKPGVPLSVSIPKINILASVESVGLDPEGKMDVPKKDEDVGWYNLGYKPGESGSAVLAGHLDTRTGAPAVFWDINRLENGDEIIVTDDKNQTFKFAVIDKQTYVYNKVPLEEIFAKAGDSVINLITCGGSFNQAARNYSHRTIVQARLIQSP